MKEIFSSDDNLIDEICKIFISDNPIFIFEFSGVYGLIASNTIEGVDVINATKIRLPNKFYSTILGSDNILKNDKHSKLFDLKDQLLEIFEGSFMRFEIENQTTSNPLICKGTHQVLIKRPSYRDLFYNLEIELSKILPPSPYFSFNHYAPICSSANISGDSAGSITSKQKALEFAKNRNIKLFVHSKLNALEQGSYPVFSIDKNLQIKIERKGLNDENIYKKAYEYFNP
jgi:hypothetical protein